MDDRARHLGGLLERTVEEFGDYECLVGDGRTWRARELLEASERLAAGLLDLGFRRGDRILTLLRNSPVVLAIYSAAWRVGLVLVPIHPAVTAREFAQYFEAAGGRGVFAAESRLEAVLPSVERAPAARVVIVPEAGQSARRDEKLAQIVHYDHLVSQSRPYERPATSADDIAAILQTGGSTGQSKATVLSHRSLSRAIDLYVHRGAQLTAAFFLPLNHIGGLATSHFYLRRGYRIVFLDSLAPEVVLSTIERHRVNILAAPPTVFISLAAHPKADQFDLSSMKQWLSGAGLFPPRQREAFQRLFPGTLDVVYGLTECCGQATTTERSPLVKQGSVGRPYPGMEVRIVGDDAQDVKRGDVGEIWIKGPLLAEGYLHSAEETETTFGGGWLKSGDLGRMDEDGDLFIVGRIKDVIIRGGQNVYPAEIENVCVAHASVTHCAAVGVANDLMGEEVVAFVVLRPGADRRAAESELAERCRESLTSYKWPRFEFIDALPLNRVNKVDKGALRGVGAERLQNRAETELARRARAAPLEARRAIVAMEVRRVVAAVLGIAESDVDPTRPLAQLGLAFARAAAISHQLGHAFGLPLPATLALSNPNTDAIADVLLAALDGEPLGDRRLSDTDAL